MRQKWILILMGAVAALTLSACGSSDSETSTATTEATVSTETEETEEALSSITPSDYLQQDAANYITVDSLEGLEVTQYTYEVTDEMIQEQIEEDLYLFSEETDVDRAAESGDVIYLDLTVTIDGSDDTYEESTYFALGDAEYGEEFDEALIGASAGDTLSFSITFSEDASDTTFIDEDWDGQTVNFEAVIDSVCEVTEAEYTDEYVAENTDYSTIEEYEAALREYLEAEYEEISYSDVLDSLFEAALDSCEISEIPDELYEACREETLASYAAFLDTTDEEEILAEFDMTEEELDSEVQDLAERRLLISYICELNDIEITEEDYVAYVEEYADYYGYDSAADFEADMDRSYLVWSMYEARAGEILYNAADITTESYDEMMEEDFDEDDLDEDVELYEEDLDEEDEPDTDDLDEETGTAEDA
ncbi:MAG: hypothetical protein LUF35_03105 [Lachnospiraceae bacterium]|nr:hypothetical protein [Lachnospiraceae bacterium]